MHQWHIQCQMPLVDQIRFALLVFSASLQQVKAGKVVQATCSHISLVGVQILHTQEHAECMLRLPDAGDAAQDWRKIQQREVPEARG